MNDFDFKIPITKTDQDRMLVFGFANVPVTADGTVVVDRHNEDIDPASLEKAAYEYNLMSRTGGLEHVKLGTARLIESFYVTPEKLTAMGLSSSFKGSAWWVGFKVDDPEVWAAVKAGTLTSFSIGGTALAEEL